MESEFYIIIICHEILLFKNFLDIWKYIKNILNIYIYTFAKQM